MPPRPLLPLLAGLAVGAGGALAVRFAFAAPSAPASAPSDLLATRYSLPATFPNPRLTAAEADAALDAYLALPPFPSQAPAAERAERAARLQALLTVLPTESFARLFATLATREGKAEGGLRRRAFKVWVERDPAAVARWAAALVPSPALDAYTRGDYLEKSTDAWADADFTAAYAWASTLADPELRHDLANQLLYRLAATDPARALTLAESGGAGFLAATRGAIFRSWAKNDPAAALRRLGADLSADDTSRWEFHEAVIQWSQADPGASIDWLAARPNTATGDSLSGMLSDIVRKVAQDPKSARSLAEALTARPDLPERAFRLRELVIGWARQDPKSALAWLETLPDADQRADFISNSLINGVGKTFDDALLFARALPAGPARDQQITHAVARWADRDPDAALAWLATQDDPSLAPAAARVQTVLINRLAATDPAAAIGRWKSLPSGSEKELTAQAIANTWAKNDPPAAARWLADQLLSAAPQGGAAPPPSPSALAGTLSPWIGRDPVAAADWLGTLPDSPLRTQSLASFTNQYKNAATTPPGNSAQAATLARIHDPAVRDQVLSDHLRNWLRLDLHAATAWIESNEALSPEAAARLLAEPAAPQPQL